MAKRFTPSFKIQAVEKALNRSAESTLKDIANELGIGHSTLDRWIVKSRNNELDSSSTPTMTKEKRPQDFCLEERLELVIRCSSLDESK